MAGTNCIIERAGSASGPWTQVYNGANSGSLSLTAQPVGVSSFYRIRGVASDGTQGTPSAAATVTSPATASGNAATGGSGVSNVGLSWSAVSGAAFYRIYRILANGNAIRIGRVLSGTTFSDYGISKPGTYTYAVSAVTPEGVEGPLSNQSSASVS